MGRYGRQCKRVPVFLQLFNLLSLCIILGGAKNTALFPEASGTPSTIHSVESSPSAIFRMPARAPAQRDWTPDESSTCCEECQALFSLVSQEISSGPHKCNTATIQLQYKLYCSWADPCNTTLQYKFSTTCRKLCRLLAAVVKKLVLQLYCACADCCNTTEFLCYFIVLYCSCIHLCGPLYCIYNWLNVRGVLRIGNQSQAVFMSNLTKYHFSLLVFPVLHNTSAHDYV